jgi:hypothetical protein
LNSFVRQVVRSFLNLFAMPFDDGHIETKPHRHAPVATYQVFVSDFDRIEEEANSIGTDLNFATFWLSEAITSFLAIPTVPPAWIHIFSSFEMAAIAGYGFGVFFLWRWFRCKNALKRLMDRIRSDQIPEFGKKAESWGLRISPNFQEVRLSRTRTANASPVRATDDPHHHLRPQEPGPQLRASI